MPRTGASARPETIQITDVFAGHELLFWVLATCVSWSVGLVLALVAADGLSLALPEAGIAIGGAVIGLAHWRFLRPAIKGAGSWLLATTVGWMAGVTATALIVRLGEWPLFGIRGALGGGCVFGCAQWLVLRPVNTRRGKWVLNRLWPAQRPVTPKTAIK